MVSDVKKLNKACFEVSELLSALSHPGRLMIIGHLLDGEKKVGELQDLCQLSQSQLSQFLSRMKEEGLLLCRREGRNQYYNLADLRVRKLVQAIQKIFCK